MKLRLRRVLCFLFDHSWLVNDIARYTDGRGVSVRFCPRCGRVQLQTHGELGWDDAKISATDQEAPR